MTFNRVFLIWALVLFGAGSALGAFFEPERSPAMIMVLFTVVCCVGALVLNAIERLSDLLAEQRQMSNNE